jgi:RecB family endonuclease NucS
MYWSNSRTMLLSFGKQALGIAPESVGDKLDITILEWQIELSKLKILIDKGLMITIGELNLARAKLVAVIQLNRWF